jgi:hypothetical protein
MNLASSCEPVCFETPSSSHQSTAPQATSMITPLTLTTPTRPLECLCPWQVQPLSSITSSVVLTRTETLQLTHWPVTNCPPRTTDLPHFTWYPTMLVESSHPGFGPISLHISYRLDTVTTKLTSSLGLCDKLACSHLFIQIFLLSLCLQFVMEQRLTGLHL